MKYIFYFQLLYVGRSQHFASSSDQMSGTVLDDNFYGNHIIDRNTYGVRLFFMTSLDKTFTRVLFTALAASYTIFN